MMVIGDHISRNKSAVEEIEEKGNSSSATDSAKKNDNASYNNG
jgi:hypothetical protein